MTKREIILQILCEHTEEPREIYEALIDTMCQTNEVMGKNLSEEVSEEESKFMIEQIKREVTDLQSLFMKMGKTEKTIPLISPMSPSFH